MEGISVVICCYNSESRIGDTLRALARQVTGPDFQIEILVIDNASTDATTQMAESIGLAPEFPFACQVLLEKRSGKSNAVELGFRMAAYKYVAIVDDDNWLDPDYFRIAWSIMEADPKIGVLGGQGVPHCEVTPPSWFSDYAVDYATGAQSATSGDITAAKRYLYGAGQVLRREAWEKVQRAQFNSLLTGRKGDKLSSGEDNEMCYAIILAGYKIWYDARLRFEHFIPARRLQWQHVERLYQGNAASEVELQPYIYWLQHPELIDQPLKPLISLRNGIRTLRYCVHFALMTVQHGDMFNPVSPYRIRVFYYWRLFRKYIQKEMRGNQGYAEVAALMKRLNLNSSH